MLTEEDKGQETVSDIVGPEQRVNRQKWPRRGHKTKIKEDCDSWCSVDVGSGVASEASFPQLRGRLTTEQLSARLAASEFWKIPCPHIKVGQ